MLIGYARVSTADQNLDLQHGAGQGRLREGADENRKGLAALTRCAAGDDTTRREGKLIFAVFAAFAEFERELIRERTMAGMRAAKRRGRHVGRPRKLTPHKLDHARRLIAEGRETKAGAAALLGVDAVTLRRALWA